MKTHNKYGQQRGPLSGRPCRWRYADFYIKSNYRSQFYKGKIMKYILIPLALALSFLSGCASVPMESAEKTEVARQFNPPSEGNSGLYIYRTGGPGTALKKDIWVDDECIGESAPKTFFYKEVKGGEEHKISTESEFSPNDLLITTDTGQNYFVKQYIKMGLFVGGANLKNVEEEEGKKAIGKLEMAVGGNCSK